MPVKRRAVRARSPVEGRASGAAPFDGNHTNDIVSWLFANEHWVDEEVEGMLDQLMMHTVNGHLAWVVFPQEGYRI